jgi:hypothetical protein
MILDLSAVTDGLIKLVKESWGKAPIWAELGHPDSPSFTPVISGSAPDALRDREGTQLSIFLYHVESDNAQESRFWNPQIMAGPDQPVSYMPFALNLYYIVSAHSNAEQGYAEEQAAMSVALRIFHANATVREEAPNPAWQLTLTMEHRSYDELSRLWQATTAPLRLSVIYRAAVVFLGVEEEVLAPEVTELNARLKAGNPKEYYEHLGNPKEEDEFSQTEPEPLPGAPSEP